MREGAWPNLPLKELCDVRIGRTPRRDTPKYWGGENVWLTIRELNGEIIADSMEHITDVALQDVMGDPVPLGTLLLSFKLSIGKMAVAGCPLYTNEAIAALPLKHPEKLDRDFLAYAISVVIDTAETSHAVKGKLLNKKKLEQILIPVPTIAEQRHIVDILKRADGIRRLRKQANYTASNLIPALFIDMFGDPVTNPKGWPVALIGDVLTRAQYGTSKKSYEDGSGIPVIRMGNVLANGGLDLQSLKYVELHERDQEKYRLEAGDILFNRTNSKDLVGKTGMWEGKFDAVAASYFIVARTDRSRVLPSYLWAYMNTPYMKQRLFDTARGAIGQSNINAKELKAFSIPLPPVELQEIFGSRLESIHSIMGQQEAAKYISETSFQSLLNQAFQEEDG